MQPIDFRIYTNGLNLYPYQKLFFTSLDYGTVRPVFSEIREDRYLLDDLRKKRVFLVTGIASPQPLVEKLEHKTYNLYTRFFPRSPFFFNDADVQSIREQVESLEDDNKIILTTEKDAVRFRRCLFWMRR